MYDESRSVPFAFALYAGAIIQLAVVFMIPKAWWILCTVAALLILIGWVSSRYFVHFDGEALRFGFRHWNVTLRLDAMRSVRRTHIGFLTFGGAGWRVRPGKIGYVRWFGPAVRIETAGREYWLSCEAPEQLERALAQAGVPVAGVDV